MEQVTVWNDGRTAVWKCLEQMGPSKLTPEVADRMMSGHSCEDSLTALFDLFRLVVFPSRRTTGPQVRPVFVDELNPLMKLAVHLAWPRVGALVGLNKNLHLFGVGTLFFPEEQATFCRALKGGLGHPPDHREEILKLWIEALTLPSPLEDADKQFLHDSIREQAETFGADLLYTTAWDFHEQHSPPFPGIRGFSEVLDSLTQAMIKIAKGQQREHHELIGTLRQFKRPNIPAYLQLTETLNRGVRPEQILEALAAIEAPGLLGTES